MSLTASARDAIRRLVALETRAVVLSGKRYAAAWSEMARLVTQDLDRLAELPLSEQETRHRLVASAAFQEYWSIVGEEQALLQRGDRGGALRIIDTMSGARAEEVRESLDGLMAATQTRILAAHAEATRLETRTWSTVLIALGGAVGLALLGTAFITRRVTRSLRLLSAATGEVAAESREGKGSRFTVLLPRS